MRRALLVAGAVVVGLAAAAGPAASQHSPEAGARAGSPAVSIGFAAVSPARIDVVMGDTVTWTNDSVRTHTVTADDRRFDSGRLPQAARCAHTFGELGDIAYHCTLHPFIRGVVGVHTLLLAAPAQAAAPNRPFPLTGRAALPAGTTVALQADRGAGFADVATTTVGADGSFVARVVPVATATYRAVAGAAVSPPVGLPVLDRRISVRAERGRDRLLIRTQVTPASPRAHVVLQLFLRDRFGWWPVQRGRLDRGSRTTFALRLRQRVAVRVLLTLPDGATPLAVSRTTRLGPTR
jgi:plastocyanin